MDDNSIIGIGPYADRKLINVPPGYLLQWYSNNKYRIDDMLIIYIKENLETLQEEVKYSNRNDKDDIYY